MINPQVFLAGITELQEWFGTELSQPNLNRYQQQLSARIDDQAFRIACNRLISKLSPREYNWPSIQQILEQVILLPEEEALLEWENVLRFIAAWRTESPIALELAECGHRALALIGGTSALAEANASQQGFMRRDFLNYRSSMRRIAGLQRTNRNELAPAPANGQVNWDSHPQKQAWIAEIHKKGVPQFIDGLIDRSNFYSHARDAGWLD